MQKYTRRNGRAGLRAEAEDQERGDAQLCGWALDPPCHTPIKPRGQLLARALGGGPRPTLRLQSGSFLREAGEGGGAGWGQPSAPAFSPSPWARAASSAPIPQSMPLGQSAPPTA